jgi:uncharacterized membrane protein YgcG
MDNNSLVISNNDESFISNGLKSVDYTTIEYIKNKHSKYVGAYSYFYLDSLNETFKSNQSFLFEYRNKKLNFNKISLDNFIEYEMPFEIDEENIIYGKKSDLNYDEVILGLNEETITALYILLFDESITYIDEQVLIDISNGSIQNIEMYSLNLNGPEGITQTSPAFGDNFSVMVSTPFLIPSGEIDEIGMIGETFVNIHALIDLNGKKAPNILDKDLRTFTTTMSFEEKFLENDKTSPIILKEADEESSSGTGGEGSEGGEGTGGEGSEGRTGGEGGE